MKNYLLGTTLEETSSLIDQSVGDKTVELQNGVTEKTIL